MFASTVCTATWASSLAILVGLEIDTCGHDIIIYPLGSRDYIDQYYWWLLILISDICSFALWLKSPCDVLHCPWGPSPESLIIKAAMLFLWSPNVSTSSLVFISAHTEERRNYIRGSTYFFGTSYRNPQERMEALRHCWNVKPAQLSHTWGIRHSPGRRYQMPFKARKAATRDPVLSSSQSAASMRWFGAGEISMILNDSWLY